MNEPSRESIEQAQQAIIDEFSFLGDWMERYQYIIDLGRKLGEFPEEWKTDENRIQGCQSQVWMHAEMRDGRLHIDAISDSAIVSGLIALLLRVYSDRTPEEILATEPKFVEAIGLSQHLSPTRNNGLHAMLQAIRNLAAEALGSRQGAAAGA